MPEFRVMVVSNVPDDLFEQAAALAKIKGPLDAFVETLKRDGVTAKVNHELGAAKKQRKPRADKGQTRASQPTLVPAA